MNTTLWIIQVILATQYAMAGIMKSSLPIDTLVKTVTWADRYPVSIVRFIGISEFLGAIGLILPWAIKTIPVLTPVAAGALALVMLLAVFHHAKHKEYKAIAYTAILLILNVYVAYGRFISL